MRNILSRLKKMQKGLNDFFGFVKDPSRETHTIKVSGQDEIAQMSEGIDENIRKIREDLSLDAKMLHQTDEIIERFKNGHMSNKQITIEPHNKNLQNLRTLLNNLLDYFGRVIRRVTGILNEYARNDFTPRITGVVIQSDGKALVDSVNSMGDEITAMLQNSLQSSTALEGKSAKLNELVTNLNKSSTEQAASLEEASASIEELTSSMNSMT
ncbi:MAG: hypothetical protein ACTTIC_08010, partial [Helicobacteraceae bacterium]